MGCARGLPGNKLRLRQDTGRRPLPHPSKETPRLDPELSRLQKVELASDVSNLSTTPSGPPVAAMRSALGDVSNKMADMKPAPKRSLFKKPAWAATDTTEQKAGDFFRHSETTFNAIMAEREQRRAREVRKQEEKASSRERETKRRRILLDLEESDSGDGQQRRSEDLKVERPITTTTPKDQKHVALPISPTKDFISLKSTISEPRAIIDHGDKSDEDPMRKMLPKPKQISPKKSRSRDSAPESEDEDEYTQELKRKAREKERLRRLDPDTKPPRTPEQLPTSHAHSFAVDQPSVAESSSMGSSVISPPQVSAKKDNGPILQILVRTEIPGGNPLVIRRYASQSLGDVKAAYCQHQKFNASLTAKVFLTWRGVKLWNSSTCTHILKKLKEECKALRLAGLDDDDDEDPSRGKIEVEAITEEIFGKRQTDKEKEALQSVLGRRGANEESSEEETEMPEIQQKFILSLRCPGLDEFKLRVKPSTSIREIIRGFKIKRNVDQGKQCVLRFEGETLDPECTIADAEIDDDVMVEVLIK